VFVDRRGNPIAYTTLYHRAWVPAREAAALDWAGLHALRHTCASLLIAEGRSPVQIAAGLGHHSPAFSMAVYGHLMDDGVGEGLHVGPPAIAA
jgi:integrase